MEGRGRGGREGRGRGGRGERGGGRGGRGNNKTHVVKRVTYIQYLKSPDQSQCGTIQLQQF